MTPRSSKVLVVEDDSSIRALLSSELKIAGYDVAEASNGLIGLELAKSGAYDLLVLDVILPGCHGTDVCRELRKTGIQSKIIMLTERSGEVDKVLGLELGADDYVTKPFSVRELIARVRVQLRRNCESENAPKMERIEVGGLAIDITGRVVKIKGKTVDLTATEFDLLQYMAKNSGRAFTRTQLLNAVWGYSSDGYEATVNTHINRLRAKIEKNPNQPDFILTVRGVGYKCATT